MIKMKEAMDRKKASTARDDCETHENHEDLRNPAQAMKHKKASKAKNDDETKEIDGSLRNPDQDEGSHGSPESEQSNKSLRKAWKP